MSKHSEEKVTAASYIINFYQDVQNLTTQNAQYLNFILELKQKDTDSIGDGEKQTIKQVVQNLRFYIMRCYIGYLTLVKTGKAEPSEEIEQNYTQTTNKFMIAIGLSEALTQNFNLFLAKTVMPSLLQTSQDVIDSVYKE